MEVWGGIECSINRVGEAYFDQLEYDRIYNRPDLMGQITSLGIKTLRFPVLWEANWPDQSLPPDWKIVPHLELLRKKNVRIIAGLVHHGSGPSYANILDADFPEKLAVYARKVAERFPYINDYTPINEPLTTARFSGLYGLWHPHGKQGSIFLQILVNECKATVLSIRAIREINPDAKLVFTEDLAKIHGSATLKEQVDFENHRRWLSIDLLSGTVTPSHVLWDHLIENGIIPAQLEFFIQHPTPPDVLGFNYYVTSERYLDERLQDHPGHTHGGNGNQAYADIEAVRHPHASPLGVAALLSEAYQRYQLPMAITEAHLCSGREDQLRWLNGIWQDCERLNQQNIPVIAVTFWSLLGAYGWDRLLTQKQGSYEPGAFELGGGAARPTAIAAIIQNLAAGQSPDSPVLGGPGWWEKPQKRKKKQRPILLIGGSGTLGTAFIKICRDRNLHLVAPKRKQLDPTDPAQVISAIKRHHPWAIINASGFVEVDPAEEQVEECLMANTIGPVNLASACAEHDIQLVNFSSDLVFDGKARPPYTESARPKPLNIYGHSKAEMENHVTRIHPAALTIRTSAFFGPWDRHNFVAVLLKALENGDSYSAMDDVHITPTYLPHLVNAALDLLIDKESGIWHLSSGTALSWYNFAGMVAERTGHDPALIKATSQQDADLAAKRPVNSALQSERGKLMPCLAQAMDEYFSQLGTP